jgi:hypothetical protein
MSVEHVIEVERIDDYRGGKFKEDLEFFHKKCGGGEINVRNQVDSSLSEGALLHCAGCRITITSLDSEQIREVIKLAKDGDENSSFEIEEEDVKFVLVPK